jgi:acetolactate synthase-1/2/3 large subunit
MGESTNTESLGGEYVCDALVEAGVELVVGLPGTQTLPLDRVIARREDLTYVMARHETAIPHVAWGYYESGGGPAATLTVPGPGDANAAHGLKNALDDGVPIIHVSADADPSAAGKHPIHEIDPHTFDNVVKENVVVDDPRRLREAVDRGVRIALTPPYGPVRLGVPSGFLERTVDSPPASTTPERTIVDDAEALATAGDELANARRPLIYVGGGARRSDGGVDAVASLADALDVPVLSSFKGQGVFPEDDDRFLGVTGKDLPAGAKRVLEAADLVVALGTDFDGLNTAEWTLPMGERLVHVDIDPGEFGAAYDADVYVAADVAEACGRLEAALGERAAEVTWDGAHVASAAREEYVDHLRGRGLLDEGPPVSTPAVLQTVRETLPDDAVVTTDIGGHRIWTKNAFPAYTPQTFVTAGSWAGMGVGLPGAIGARLANPGRPVVCLSGDGSLMMCAQEFHTAVEYDVDLTVVVFDDADYGVISKSAALDGEDAAPQFGWTSPDWVGLVESYGGEGRRADTRSTVRDALEWSLDESGPTLVHVDIDPDEPTAAQAAAYETSIDLPEPQS